MYRNVAKRSLENTQRFATYIVLKLRRYKREQRMYKERMFGVNEAKETKEEPVSSLGLL